MRRATPLCLALCVATACAPIARVPLRLPPRDAPTEVRAMAYRANAAEQHQSFWQGGRVTLGDAPQSVSLREARAVLENAPEAAAILAERDRRTTIGWGLLGGGAAVMLGSVGLAPLAADGSLGTSRDTGPLIFALTAAAGLAAMIAGMFVGGAGDAEATRAAGAYNRWLWDALALPRPGVPLAPAVTVDAPWAPASAR